MGDGSVALAGLVGRGQELADLGVRLRATRLLTLTGAGGIGKTRLARALADALTSDFPDGIGFVDLAALADPALLPEAIAAGVDLTIEADHRPVRDQLAAALSDRTALLVLDNCEHLIEACAEIAIQLLCQCPGLRVLATSRVALRVPGEQTWRVPSLGLPATDGLADVTDSEAASLFVARAQLCRPEFALTGRTAAGVAEICRRLDGIPLALELAASRVRVLALDDIATRLDDHAGLLRSGGRGTPARHRTLESTLDWSYRLLDEPARLLLRSVSVFMGGFPLDAAEAMVLPSEDALDTLERLVDSSLVEADTTGTRARHRLLEVVRQYAARRLAEAGGTEQAEQAYTAWCIELAEEAERQMRGPDQGAWLNRIEAELANMRAALRRALDRGDGANAQRLAGALRPFWEFRGHLREGRRWCEAALAAAPVAQQKLLHAAGIIAHRLGDHDTAAVWVQGALELARAGGDVLGMARALNALGMIAESQADYAGADEWYRLGLAKVEELGDRYGVAVLRSNLSNVALARGDLDAAQAHLEAAVALHRLARVPLNEAITLANLATVALRRGDVERARRCAAEAIEVLWNNDLRQDLPEVLGIAAMIGAARARMRDAVVLFAAAEYALQEMGTGFSKSTVELHAPSVKNAHQYLGPAAYEAARGVGTAMSLADAVALAIEVTAPSTSDRQADRGDAGLTGREREVAVYVARGLTNRQIAQYLSISVRTVDTHVTHLFEKLGVQARAQIAAWAAERGLLAEIGTGHR